MRARSVCGLMSSSAAAPCSPSMRPRVLLLDEPFGALDSRVRKELRRWLRRLHDELGLTSVFVTHDQEEAPELADRVVVMNRGRIEQVGTPEEIHHEPANAFVYEFLGDVNVFHARIEGEQARVYVRPHLLEVERRSHGEGDGELRARVERIHAAGPTVKLDLLTDAGDRVQAELTQERYRGLGLARGAIVFLKPRQKRVFVNDFSI